MQTKTKNISAIAIIVLLSLILVGVILILVRVYAPKAPAEPTPTPDPHEGQVLVDDGFKEVWITPMEEVEPSSFSIGDFLMDNGRAHYVGDGYEVLRGIDVSEHQKVIDWERAAQDEIDFAYLRVGYRGTTLGGLFLDEYFEDNLAAAQRTDLKLGVYFFSQAVSKEEAVEEAEFVLSKCEGVSFDLPIVFDWEKADGYRNESVSYEELTDIAIAFCERVREAGYEAGIYFSKQLGYYGYDLSRLTDYLFWVTDPGDFPDFYYAQAIWQYSWEEHVDGIGTETDMNLMFVPTAPAPSAGETEAPET